MKIAISYHTDSFLLTSRYPKSENFRASRDIKYILWKNTYIYIKNNKNLITYIKNGAFFFELYYIIFLFYILFI